MHYSENVTQNRKRDSGKQTFKLYNVYIRAITSDVSNVNFTTLEIKYI